jgi:hypothetical protein
MFCFSLLLSLVAPASALSPDLSLTGVLPADGAADVALNVAPVITTSMLTVTHEGDPDGFSDHSIALFNPAEDVFVQATVEFLGGDAYQLLPAEDLTANTDYVVVSDPPMPGGGAEGQLTTFTTGDWIDEAVPTIPQPLSVSQRTTTDEWGDWHTFTVTQLPAGDESGVVYTVELVELGCALGEQECADPVSAAFIGDGVEAEPDHSGGARDTEALMFRADPTGAYHPGATFQPHDTVVRVSTVDLAGNVAPLVCSVPEGIDPIEAGCADAAASGTHSADADEGFACGTGAGMGCSSIPAPAASAFLVLLSLFAAGRRSER